MVATHVDFSPTGDETYLYSRTGRLAAREEQSMDHDQPERIRSQCPMCGKIIGVRADQLGLRLRCPACRHVFTLQAAADPPTEPIQNAGGRQASTAEWLTAENANELTRPEPLPSSCPTAKVTATFRRPKQVVFQAAIQVLRSSRCIIASIDQAGRHVRFSFPSTPGEHNLFVFDGSNQSCEMDISSVSQNDNNRYDLHYQLIIREMGKYLQFAPEAEASPPPRPATAYPVQKSISRRRRRRRGDDDDDPARERRDAQARRQTTTLILVILGVIFVLPIIACGGIFFFAALTPNNAQCPGCGKEFHISNEHRGNNSMWTREYRCPRCHNSWPAAVLYK